jgi:hypothetical protein
MNFKEIFYSYYIVWLRKMFSMILDLLEHFKLKYAQKSNKNLGSAFCIENYYFLKIVSLSKVVTFFRWDFFCFFIF